MRTLFLMLTMCLFVLPADAKYSGGSGTDHDPYRIATAADLIALGEIPEDYNKHFVLTADIDLDPNLPGRKVFDKAVIGATVWLSDWGHLQGTPFTGVFDGNGHTISHLTINGTSFCGLFGRLESGAEVKNLAIVDANVTGSGSYIGGLVGYNSKGTVTRCSSTGVVSGTQYSLVGGLVGENWGPVTNSHSASVVSGQDFVGGLVGANRYGPITTCYSTGIVNGTKWGVGGLVGHNENGDIATCYSTGAVTGGASVGGLIGLNTVEDGGIVTRCYSTSRVSGNSDVGGLIGANGPTWIETSSDGGSVTECYSCGAVSGSSSVGGLVGYNDGTVITSFWDIQTSGQAASAAGTGKTTAEMQNPTTFAAARWDLVGEVVNGTHEVWQMPEGGGYPVLAILKGYTPCQLQGLGTPENPYLISDMQQLGAIQYYNPEAHYRLVADIDLTGIRWTVAVIPLLRGTFDGHAHTISHLTIETLQTTSSGRGAGLFGELGSGAEARDLGVTDVNVTGSDYWVGALVGSNGSLDGARGSVTRCYSTGAVSGGWWVGGLVGYNRGSIAASYSTTLVRGGLNVGGLVGCNQGNVTESYSTGSVTGGRVCGLVGSNSPGGGVLGTTDASFWDIQTSRQTGSAGGTGKTTAEMQTAKTFLDAGWDFVGETANGTADLWWILEGQDYPRLWWEAHN